MAKRESTKSEIKRSESFGLGDTSFRVELSKTLPEERFPAMSVSLGISSMGAVASVISLRSSPYERFLTAKDFLVLADIFLEAAKLSNDTILDSAKRTVKEYTVSTEELSKKNQEDPETQRLLAHHIKTLNAATYEKTRCESNETQFNEGINSIRTNIQNFWRNETLKAAKGLGNPSFIEQATGSSKEG